jgi:hypothetical protein
MNWQPEWNSGHIINGCLPKSDESEASEHLMLAEAVPFSYDLSYAVGDMPIIAWDSDWEAFLKQRHSITDIYRTERIQNIAPWAVAKKLGTDRIYWSQGNVGSCMAHAEAFAYHSSVLSGIALGLPLEYEPVNPIVTFAISKNGSIRGGQSPAPMAHATNKVGHYLEEWVGNNNQVLPQYQKWNDDAKSYQSGIVFIPGKGEELVQRIIDCVHAAFGVAFGNSHAVSGVHKDSNGVYAAMLNGYWKHATSFAMYNVFNNTEYLYWVNSHGKRYTPADGVPADGAWMSRTTLSKFASSMTDYGMPFAVLPETTFIDTKNVTPRIIVQFSATNARMNTNNSL